MHVAAVAKAGSLVLHPDHLLMQLAIAVLITPAVVAARALTVWSQVRLAFAADLVDAGCKVSLVPFAGGLTYYVCSPVCMPGRSTVVERIVFQQSGSFPSAVLRPCAGRD